MKHQAATDGVKTPLLAPGAYEEPLRGAANPELPEDSKPEAPAKGEPKLPEEKESETPIDSMSKVSADSKAEAASPSEKPTKPPRKSESKAEPKSKPKEESMRSHDQEAQCGPTVHSLDRALQRKIELRKMSGIAKEFLRGAQSLNALIDEMSRIDDPDQNAGDQDRNIVSKPRAAEAKYRNLKGDEMSTGKILRCFRKYDAIFGSESRSGATFLDAVSVENRNIINVILCLEFYEERMSNLLMHQPNYIPAENLEQLHATLRKSAERWFDCVSAIDATGTSEKFREKLLSQIDRSYLQFHLTNETTRMTQMLRTPLLLSFTCVTLFFAAEVLRWLGIVLLDDVLNTFAGALTIILLAWVYSRSTGNVVELGDAIDDRVDKVWMKIKENVERFSSRVLERLGKRDHEDDLTNSDVHTAADPVTGKAEKTAA
ncbi:uncharacterized protein LOC100898817 [Galendromus occidentalis]|uniref:Uncharacterized protein LOC100898817 n=1 Tax=Galendromus occidentalis TaxID=34638 RepID=A0AAJ6QKY7_9ACAR|nr:uncharacterized protein LOC100898817 [Galendromus occidentalis]